MTAPTPSSRNANSGAEIVCAEAALNRAVHMFIDQIEAAIADASSASLVELNRVIWQGLGSGALIEDDAGRLAEAIDVRQTAAKAAGGAVGALARPSRILWIGVEALPLSQAGLSH